MDNNISNTTTDNSANASFQLFKLNSDILNNIKLTNTKTISNSDDLEILKLQKNINSNFTFSSYISNTYGHWVDKNIE